MGFPKVSKWEVSLPCQTMLWQVKKDPEASGDPGSVSFY
jgi:hypothetical protein